MLDGRKECLRDLIVEWFGTKADRLDPNDVDDLVETVCDLFTKFAGPESTERDAATEPPRPIHIFVFTDTPLLIQWIDRSGKSIKREEITYQKPHA